MSHLEDRLQALRDLMRAEDIAGFVIPRADEHQSEYVAPADERLRWVCGFTGSAGVAVVTQAAAVLFVDGRYTIQAGRELGAGWQSVPLGAGQPAQWLADSLGQGARLGFDPRLHRPAEVDGWRASGLVPVALKANPVDALWHDRPAPPLSEVVAYPLDLAGEGHADKRARLWAELESAGLDGLVISAPENLAWLTNTRGSDIPMVPVSFAYGIVTRGGLCLHFAPQKLTPGMMDHLRAEGIAVAAPGLPQFAQARGQRLRFDQATASVALAEAAITAGVEVDLGPDPIAAMKACKNPVEAAGMRAANLRDAVALVRFLHWFETVRPQGCDEWQAAEVLGGFRAELPRYKGPSFGTISAAGESAALAHYKTAPETARHIGAGEIYLCDSGGQYLDGTTDVTRVTVAGDPTPEMRTRYTQVLRGHLALLRQCFPQGIDGAQLDPLARQFLWQDGVDFAHGTGHGVGHYLSVHEGPALISQRGRGVPLRAGMVLSIEPGFYKPGAYGIRIENLALVVEQAPGLLGFESLTWVPYARALIDISALTLPEIDQIDSYHAEVMTRIGPLLEEGARCWLEQATQPLGQHIQGRIAAPLP